MLRRMVLMAVLIVLLSSYHLNAGEIIFGWNITNPSGKIYDMEFMPDNDYFILTTASDIQIRMTKTGELVKTYAKTLYYADHDIEFSPDSTRIILSYGNTLELRNLNDMNIINSYFLKGDPDGLIERLSQVRIDPIKPLLYVLFRRSGTLSGDIHADFRKILIYNYETMTQVGELTTGADTTILWSQIAISKDGKYLAAMSRLYSVLKVWSLETQKEIKYLKLSNEIDALSDCLKFSEINTDKIYFSGYFPQSKTDGSHRGLFVYDIAKNKIIDSTFAGGKINVETEYFIYFDDEERILVHVPYYIQILNIKNHSIEYNYKVNSNPIVFGEKIIKTKNANKFIGKINNWMSFCQYDSQVGVTDLNKSTQILYPNPTSNILTLPISGFVIPNQIQIFDLKGQRVNLEADKIYIQNNEIQINVSGLENGTYLLTIQNSTKQNTYKFIVGR